MDWNMNKLFKPGIENETYIHIVFLVISAFAILFFWPGIEVLNIFNVDWLSGGDTVRSFASSTLYRYSDFQFPLGDMTNVDYPLGSNIIFSDGNLFLSLLLKLFSFILPDKIQIYGWWLLLCLVLQFVSSWWLLKQLRIEGIALFFSALMLGLYPAFFERFGHLNLEAHFIIITAIGIYFAAYDFKKKIKQLFFLLLFSLSVHFYFVPVVVGITILLSSEMYIKQKLSLQQFVLTLGSTFVLLIVSMYIIGYFSGFDSGAEGFGYFSMNINSPLNSMGKSSFINGMSVGTEGQYEGFQYFGAGVIALILIALFTKKFFSYFSRNFTRPLVLFLLIVTMISLSDKWYLGSFLVLEFKLPPTLMELFSPFRASGRYFWVVGYFLIAIVLASLYAKLDRSSKVFQFNVLLLILILIQIYDIKPLFELAANKKEYKAAHSTFSAPEYKALVDYLDKENFFEKPLIVEGDERNDVMGSIIYLAGEKIKSIGPWMTVRRSLRFEKEEKKLKYVDIVKEKRGVLISKGCQQSKDFNELIYKNNNLCIFAAKKVVAE